MNHTNLIWIGTLVLFLAMASPAAAQSFYFNEFNDSTTEKNMSFVDDYEQLVGFKLPKSSAYAHTINATVNVTGYWIETTAVFDRLIDVSGETTLITGVGNNGTNYFALGYQANEEVHAYTYDGTFVDTCTLNVLHDLPGGMVHNVTNFFVMDEQNGYLRWYTAPCTYIGNKINFNPYGLNPHGIDFNGTYFWATDGTNLTRWNEDGSYDDWSVTLLEGADGLVFDGTYFYTLYDPPGGLDGVIKKYWENGTYTDWTFNATDCDFANGLDFNGTHFAVGCNQDEIRIYEIIELYPSNITLDVDNDGTDEWIFAGPLNTTNSPQQIDLNNNTALQDFLFGCTYDDDGYCNITLNFTASNGIIELSSLNITYNLDEVITQCGSLSNTTIYNFTLYNEEDPLTKVTGDLDIAFTEIYVGPDLVTNASFNFTGDSDYSLCITPSWANYTITATLLYEADDYTVRTYYLVDNVVLNDSQLIDIYLINDTVGALVQFSLVDATNTPVEEAYLRILRHYVGENEFRIVAIARTDFDGKGVTYLALNDVFYRFIIIKNGTILDDIDPTFITASTLNIQLGPGTLGNIYSIYDTVQSLCYYSNVTESLACDMTDTTGETRTVCMEVTQILNLGQLEICNSCSTGSSVTITCPVGNITDRLFYYKFDVSGSSLPLEAGYLQGDLPANPYGVVGLISAVFVILVLSFISRSPSIMMINVVVGIGLLATFTILSIPWSGVIGIATVAGFLIYVVRK